MELFEGSPCLRCGLARCPILYREKYSKLSNVVGLGIVPVDETEKKKGSQDLAVGVYVSKMTSDGNGDVPETLTISGKSGNIEVPVRVIEQGIVQREIL